MERIDALKKLRDPFPAHQISKLPKPTKAQTDEVKLDFHKGIRCSLCGAWHHPKVVHLDYVGHAALTDRLLDVDPEWSWKPAALDADGLPKLDKVGGLWIYLTVCGVTRMGYGNAEGKSGGDAVKELIGDALRNAAMRFGAALDLWHKGELHVEQPEESKAGEEPSEPSEETHVVNGWTIEAQDEFSRLMDGLYECLREMPEEYEKRSETWRGRMRADHADKVIPAFQEFIRKLQAATAKPAAVDPAA